MIDIVPTGKILGATVNGMDLSQALAGAAFDQILRALGRYGVLRFPAAIWHSLRATRPARATPLFTTSPVGVDNSRRARAYC
jgi:hypothetical protein